MLDDLRFRYKYWKLQQEKKRLLRHCKKELEEARRQNKTANEIATIESGWSAVIQHEVDDVSAYLETRYLIKATETFLPHPANDSSLWQDPTYPIILTREATAAGAKRTFGAFAYVDTRSDRLDCCINRLSLSLFLNTNVPQSHKPPFLIQLSHA